MDLQRRPYLPLLFLLFVATITFVFTLPVTLPDGDTGEYLLKGLHGGIVHPPGYPLYYMLLRGLSFLGGVFPVVPLFAFFSSLCSLVAAAIIYRLSFGLTDSPVAAFVAASSILFAGWCWRSFVNIEPYGLHALLVSSGMYYLYAVVKSLSAAELAKPVGILGIIFGLGFCHHHSLALLLPATFVAVVWSAKKNRCVVKSVIYFGIGSMIGLTPLLVFLSVDPAAIYNWGDWQNFWPRLFQHLSRAEYSTAEFERSDWSSYISISWYFYKNLWEQLSFVLGIPLLAGIVHAFRSSGRMDRAYYVLLAMCLFFSTIIFFGALNLPTDDANVIVFSRFFMMPSFLLAPFIGRGWLVISNRFKTNSLLSTLVPIALLFFHLMYQLPGSDRSSERFVERHILNIISLVPDGSIILTKDVLDYQGLMYGLHVLGGDRDVVVVQPPMWRALWYRKKTVAALGFPPEAANYQLEALLETLVVQRPVFTTTLNYSALSPYLLDALPLGPIFRLDRLKPSLSPEAMLRINEKIYEDHRLLPKSEELEHLTLWEWVAVRDYYDAWIFLEKRLRAVGLSALADGVRVRADKIKPPFINN